MPPASPLAAPDSGARRRRGRSPGRRPASPRNGRSTQSLRSSDDDDDEPSPVSPPQGSSAPTLRPRESPFPRNRPDSPSPLQLNLDSRPSAGMPRAVAIRASKSFDGLVQMDPPPPPSPQLKPAGGLIAVAAANAAGTRRGQQPAPGDNSLIIVLLVVATVSFALVSVLLHQPEDEVAWIPDDLASARATLSSSLFGGGERAPAKATMSGAWSAAIKAAIND